MPKRIHIIVLAIVAIVCTGCHHKAEPQETPVLPSLHVTMTPLQVETILASRDNKVPACALLTNAQGDTLFHGDILHFKTRGNTSFKEDKKSFAIKFPEKRPFLGLEKSRSFVLLANACDESHIRNAIAFDLARAIGIPAPRYAYLTLYINDIYWGLYQMTNKVDVGKNDLIITDLEKLNELVNSKPLGEYEWYGLGRKKTMVLRKGVLLENDPDDITGGYLIDVSGPHLPYDRSLSGFVSNADDNIRIISPEHVSPREIDYISNRYNEMESAVMALDGINPETGRHYSEYIDVQSFARYYLLNELLFNWDGGWSSFMMYKDADVIDPRFHAGPAWDYDRTLDNSHFQKSLLVYPNELYVCKKNGKIGFASSGGLLYYLCQHEDFQKAVRDCYSNEVGVACHSYLEASPFDSLASLLSHEADLDNTLNKTRLSADYSSAVTRATDFLRKRIAFFDSFYSTNEDEQVIVYYEEESGKTRKFYYPLGEHIQAPQLEVLYNHTSIYEMFYSGTDSIVSNGTVFQTSQKLELRKREPTKHEVQIRRVKKKLRKLGIDF